VEIWVDTNVLLAPDNFSVTCEQLLIIPVDIILIPFIMTREEYGNTEEKNIYKEKSIMNQRDNFSQFKVYLQYTSIYPRMYSE
jgi:hypothetical protein